MRPLSLRSWTLTFFSAFLQLLPFPIAGPVPLWRRILCWFCLVPLISLLLDEKRPLPIRKAALCGYVCGFFWYLGNCYWIYQTMHFYGEIPRLGALGILVLFSLYLGLYHALFAVLLKLLAIKLGRRGALVAVPLIWVSVEIARARITGFPWDLLGYTQVDSLLLTKLAPLTGVLGISFAIAAVNALWLTFGKRFWKFAGPVTAIALVAVSTERAQSFPGRANATAVLLQENLSVGGERPKQVESKEQMITSFEQLSLQSASSITLDYKPPQIIVWPEAPAEFADADASFRSALGDLARKSAAPIIADSISYAPPDEQGQPHLYNTASFFSASGEHVGRYDKMHLVPFGEYTPYKALFFFAGHLLDNVGPFVPGNVRRLFVTGGHRYGVFICYESIFGDEIREFAKMGADVLVNISDDGWYGDTSAPWEHLDMVRMRAIENSRWVLRATNTGVTSVIDPHGRLTAELPRHVRSSMAAQFSYRDSQTFYTKHGDWFAWVCVATSLSLLVIGLNNKPGSKLRAC